MEGIFKRTNEPKLAIEIPTEKAKNKENNTLNNTKGFFQMMVKNPMNFSRNKSIKVKIII